MQPRQADAEASPRELTVFEEASNQVAKESACRRHSGALNRIPDNLFISPDSQPTPIAAPIRTIPLFSRKPQSSSSRSDRCTSVSPRGVSSVASEGGTNPRFYVPGGLRLPGRD